MLDLPVEERAELEQAESFALTPEEPALRLKPGTEASSEAGLCVVVNLGTLEAAEFLHNCGFSRIAILNFELCYNCGGGFEHAGGNQDETIFRGTSIFLSLWPHRCSDAGPGVLPAEGGSATMTRS